MRRKVIALLTAVAGVSGCGLMPSPEEQATDVALEKARRVGNVLNSSSYRIWKAEDVGHRAADLRDVEVMQVSGTSIRDRGGVRVVVRVEGSAADGWGGQTVTVRRCYALTVSNTTKWDTTPKQVACPQGAPLKYGPWPKTPELPYERLRKELPRVPSSGTVNEGKVRTAVARLRLDPAIHIEYMTKDNVVGVVLIVRPYLDDALDCLLARIAPGATNVWSPPRVQRTPGEAGCTAANAISPMPPPH